MDGDTFVRPVFERTGPLMDINSYPHWLQDIVHDCSASRRAVIEHELFQRMSAGTLPVSAMKRFLVGVWPVIEQFPQYMAMNLIKVQYHAGRGHAMARTYLIRNIRVEQNHGEYWLDWATGHDITREELFHASRSSAMDALSHWCWRTCEADPLPVAMAATNYAIEGATGEWAARVCNAREYTNQFAPDVRTRAIKWLRVHAHYDDTHPWEALEIIATLVGARASAREIAAIHTAIVKSYEYMVMAFNDCFREECHRHSIERVPVITTASLRKHESSRTAPGIECNVPQ